jgi:hypothetical protein
VVATSFTAAALIGAALALAAQAMASPAARLRNNSVLRMNLSPEIPIGNDIVSLWFHTIAVRCATHLAAPESGDSLRPLIKDPRALANGVAAERSAPYLGLKYCLGSVQRTAGEQHALDAHPVAAPLLDLVVVAIVREQGLVGFLVSVAHEAVRNTINRFWTCGAKRWRSISSASAAK